MNDIPETPTPRATPVHVANLAVSQAVADTPEALIVGQSGTDEDVLIYQINTTRTAARIAAYLGATAYHRLGSDERPTRVWELKIGDRPVVLCARDGDEDHMLALLLDDAEPVVTGGRDLFAALDGAVAELQPTP